MKRSKDMYKENEAVAVYGDFPYLVGYKRRDEFEIIKGFKAVHLAWAFFFEVFPASERREELRVRLVKEETDAGFRYFTESSKQ